MIRVAFVIGGYPPEEHKRRADVALSYSSEEVQVGIVDVKASPYFYGMTPAEIQACCAGVYRELQASGRPRVRCRRAAGDPRAWGRRGESGRRYPGRGADGSASIVGDKFGAIVYHESQLGFLRAIVRRYGMEERMVGFGVSGFDLPDLAANHDKVVENFVREARRLIGLGAEIIFPMGISQCPVHIKPDWLQKELGVPVVGAIGAPIRMAALLVGLGLKQSRVRWPKSRTGEK
jgi:hypothetical protein